MISITNDKVIEFRGLSTDQKPISDKFANGTMFIEMDTSTIYTYDAAAKEWLVLDWNNSVSIDDFLALKEEVEDIKKSPDVAGVVGTYADLLAYDTSKLFPNSAILVLYDEHMPDQAGRPTRSYYNWTGEVFEHIYSIEIGYSMDTLDEYFANFSTKEINEFDIERMWEEADDIVNHTSLSLNDGIMNDSDDDFQDSSSEARA